MKSNPRTSKPIPAANIATDPSFETNILRLVNDARACRAIKSGEVDAILDPTTGRAILLPEAQAALLDRKSQFRSLIELASDGYWEQDQDYRFTSHSGTVIGSEPAGAESILGKSLWDLPFDNRSEVDWQTHRTQLEWRAIFRDLEFRCMDRTGKLRIIKLSGEPMFDLQGQFMGYRGITRDITELKQAEIGEPESDRFARATLDALATQVCVLDVNGVIITANNAWRVFATAHHGLSAGVGEGSNYLALCDRIVGSNRVDATTMAGGIRQVIAGDREIFRYEHFYDSPVGPRWFMATTTRLQGDGPARATVAYEDITAIKRTEQMLRLEYNVALALANAQDTASALKAVIRAVCETQNWDCGRYFRLDPAAGEFSFVGSWGLPLAAVDQFLKKSRGVVFRLGAGLSGRVAQSGQPLWILSASKDARAFHAALAHEIGMDGAFIFPVLDEGQAIGVFAFASRIVHEPDDRLLQAVAGIGDQLRQFLPRQQAEDALYQSEARLRRLIGISSDWVWEQGSDFRFTHVDGGNMQGNGHVVGLSLWDPSSEVVLSDNLWIQHKSQLAEHWSFCDFEYAVTHADGLLSYYSISGEPLYDEAGVFSGYRGTGVDITARKRAEIASRSVV